MRVHAIAIRRIMPVVAVLLGGAALTAHTPAQATVGGRPLSATGWPSSSTMLPKSSVRGTYCPLLFFPLLPFLPLLSAEEVRVKRDSRLIR